MRTYDRPCKHCDGPVEWTSTKGPKYYCNTCAPAKKDVHRLRRYQLSKDEFDAMYFEQDGACLVFQYGEATHVDHDHACCPGEVTCGRCIRGLLCDDCNIALGRFKDNKTTLARAIEYLEEWE